MSSARLDVPDYEEVRLNRIINQYRNIEVLHPVVARLCEVPAHRKILHEALTQDLDIIHSRSPHLPDFEITIYQKAFKILMDREEDRIGGIEIYVDEILGVKLSGSTESLETLKTAVDARDLVRKSDTIEKRLSSSARKRSDLSPSKDINHYQRESLIYKVDNGAAITQDSALHMKNRITSTSLIGINVASTDNNLEADHTPEIDPKINRLWNLYQTGRAEYNSCPKGGFAHSKAARFLRDTIENGLVYIERAYPSVICDDNSEIFQDAKLSAIRNKAIELRASLNEITPVVEKAYGGQKRRFGSETCQSTAHAPEDKQSMSLHHLDRDMNTDRASEFHHSTHRDPVLRDSEPVPEIIRRPRSSKTPPRPRSLARPRIRIRSRSPPSSRFPPCVRSPLSSPGPYDNGNTNGNTTSRNVRTIRRDRESWRGGPTTRYVSFPQQKDRYRPTY